MKKNKKQILFFLLCAVILGWLALIFTLSAQPAHKSDGLSKNVTKIIIISIDTALDISKIDSHTVSNLVDKFNHIVRKYAHFTAYLILGMMMMLLLKLKEVKMKRMIIYSYLATTLYAMSDEFHQLFVAGRGAQITDVMIDSSGAVVGICVFALYIIKSKKACKL